jgi:hypothetical protein
MIHNGLKFSWVHENNTEKKQDSFTHCQVQYKAEEEWQNYLNPRGVQAKGTCKCIVTDNYNKHIGRKLSFGRAIDDMGLDKEEKTILWKAFLDKFPKTKNFKI